MNSESILLSLPPHEKAIATRVADSVDLDLALDGLVLESTSGLMLLGIINDRLLPQLGASPEGQRVKTGFGLERIFDGLDIRELAGAFGVAAINVVREKILPKIREANGTVALIVSNLLELAEGKLRAA